MKNRKAIQQRMERFVRDTLLQKLGWPQHRFSLEATELGVHNHVFFLHIEGAPALVVKGIAKQQRFKTLVAAADHLLYHGVRVPRILYSHEDRTIFPWQRLHVICEERITGTTAFAADSPAALVPAIAGFFSHLHTIRRDSWGKLSERNRDGLHEYLLAKTHGRLQQWKTLDGSLSQRVPERCTAWMNGKKTAVNNITSFSLSHGDPNPGNIMVQEDGSMCLLDVGHIRYLPRQIDYYQLVVHFCRDSGELLRLFDDRYFAGMAAGEREEFTASQQFFKLYVLIDFGHNLARRCAATDPKHPWHQEFTDNSKKVKRAMEEILGV
jgi:aminoglycoside phosphotransferase (APT) family kinase protein